MNFEMKVIDVFHFQNGQTVLAGLIEDHQELIRSCQAEILIDGKVQETIKILGEMLPDRRHPQGYRAISTLEPTNLTTELLKVHNCKLRAIC